MSETSDSSPGAAEQGIYSASGTPPNKARIVVEITARRGTQELGHDLISFRRENGVAENFHREQNRDLLEKLASETGGHYYHARDAGRLARRYRLFGSGDHGREIMDLWNMPVVFFARHSVAGGEWLLRRRWGAV